MATADVIAAFSEEDIERLTGITKSQLRYWDRTGFFVPSYADENRRSAFSRIYSFKDLLSLRVIFVLRNQHGVALQHLRKVRDRLMRLADDLWTGTTLWVFRKKVIFQEPGMPRPQEAVGGQFVLDLPLEKVVTATRNDVQTLLERPKDRVGQVQQSRFINHNAWVIAGTRIPTAAIRRFAEAGYSEDQILSEYPDLTPDDVKAALDHERKHGHAA